MKTQTKAALAIGTSALVIAAMLQGAAAASASPNSTLRFTNQLDSRQIVQAHPGVPTAGDATYIASHAVAGARGRTVASCALVTPSGGGVRQCEVDFLLSGGTLTTRGITDLASTRVALVITGGTGRYGGVHGSGTLTGTPTGSVVMLRLR